MLLYCILFTSSLNHGYLNGKEANFTKDHVCECIALFNTIKEQLEHVVLNIES